MSNKKATMSEMNDLHGALAVYFKESLETGEELSSGTLAAINSFLKTNNITVDLTVGSPANNMSDAINSILKEHKEEKEA